VDWIGLAKDRNRWRAHMNSVLNLLVPWNAGKLSSDLSSSSESLRSWEWNMSSPFSKHEFSHMIFIWGRGGRAKKNSVARVCGQTIPPLVSVVSAILCGYRVSRGQRDWFLRPYSRLSGSEPLLFLSSSVSILLTRLSGTRSRPTTSQQIW
jgi:hypothetical protein